MTRFSFEVPIPNLKDFDEDQDFVMALFHLLEDPRYAEWVMEQKRQGKYVILDNSFNELDEPQDWLLMGMAHRILRPNKVISPDANWWTAEQLEAEYRNLCNFVKTKNSVMLVLKSKREVNHFLQLGVDIENMAVSYEWRHYFDRDSLKAFAKEGLFFLGLTTIEELRQTRPAFLDTSMPIKLALHSMSMRDWVNAGQQHIHTRDDRQFFQRPLTTSQVDLAKANIAYLKEVAKCQEDAAPNAL